MVVVVVERWRLADPPREQRFGGEDVDAVALGEVVADGTTLGPAVPIRESVAARHGRFPSNSLRVGGSNTFAHTPTHW